MKRVNVQTDLRGFILIVAAVAWMAGILLDSWQPFPQYALLTGAAIALVCVIFFWRDSRWLLVSLALLWLLLGAWRYATASPIGDPQAINAFIGVGKVVLRGTVADDPKLLNRSSLLLVAVSSISTNGGASWRDAHGQNEVQTPGSSIDTPYGQSYGDSCNVRLCIAPDAVMFCTTKEK